MTREEEIKEARHEWYLRTQDADFCAGFQKGAEWADHTMINKACELLYEYNRKQADKMFGTVHTADVTINVAEFRKAMKGE